MPERDREIEASTKNGRSGARRLALALGAGVALFSVVVVTAAWTIAVQSPGIIKPDTVWPTSVVGWLTAASVAVILLINLGNIVANQKKPLTSAIDKLEAVMRKEVADVEGRMMQEISRIERDMTNRFDQARKETSREISGFGGRVTEVERDYERLEQAIGKIAEDLIESKQDRRYLNVRLTEMARTLEEDRKDRLEQERKRAEALSQMETRLVAHLVRSPG